MGIFRIADWRGVGGYAAKIKNRLTLARLAVNEKKREYAVLVAIVAGIFTYGVYVKNHVSLCQAVDLNESGLVNRFLVRLDCGKEKIVGYELSVVEGRRLFSQRSVFDGIPTARWFEYYLPVGIPERDRSSPNHQWKQMEDTFALGGRIGFLLESAERRPFTSDIKLYEYCNHLADSRTPEGVNCVFGSFEVFIPVSGLEKLCENRPMFSFGRSWKIAIPSNNSLRDVMISRPGSIDGKIRAWSRWGHIESIYCVSL